MPGLYPRIKPYATHRLAVDPQHVLYVEESGDVNGIPVLFIHGGPGSGCLPYQRTFFDPERYRIILFDQRGSGQSTPHASLENNTTQDLIADIEKIREFLHVHQWILFGGSWGSTLSLLYAQNYPDKVLAMILRGVFLCRQDELDWFYQGGVARFFPDHWRDFVSLIPEPERGDVVRAYHQRLTGNNELARMAAAKAWAKWVARTSAIQPSKTVLQAYTEAHTAMSLSRIQAHYFINKGFLEPNQILDNFAKIAHIPGVIVQGRYDMVRPMKSAYEIYQTWPKAALDIIPDAGHSATERGIVDALVRATIEYSKEFEPGT